MMIAAAIAAVVKLGPIPGNIANDRWHPQSEAINVLGATHDHIHISGLCLILSSCFRFTLHGSMQSWNPIY
ncbi:MAG TPA: hypothetical protein EYQ14_10110 [Gammaproteobacteria bacterium]|nr:hypothetical protein [Gammaproteobacteria bacterium]